jgi:hypothetical protein
MGAVGDLLGLSPKKADNSAQVAALNTQKAEADKALADRQKRMENKKAGRASLLSGTELGVMGNDSLSKTLG